MNYPPGWPRPASRQPRAVILAGAGRACPLPVIAFGVTKKAAWAALDLSFDAALDLENRTQLLTLLTEDSTEAHHAFLEKRPPRWRGE
jgi:enoyl-CoA hydratase/carnithine racemase